MPTFAFTVVDEGTETVVEGSTTDHGAVFIPPAEIERALRWQLKPEGFCLNDVCYPVPPDVPVVSTNGVDLAALASLLDRPIAVDVAERAAFLGTAAAHRAETLGTLEAPGFTLPDLEGKPHSLSDHRGKKVLLAAYASW